MRIGLPGDFPTGGGPAQLHLLTRVKGATGCRSSGAVRSAAIEGVQVKVHVIPEKCQGHNRCYALAPDLFEVDDFGSATEVGDGTVPPGQEDLARLAVANCPEFAIELIDAPAPKDG